MGSVQIGLVWQDESANEDEFRIERRLGEGAWTPVGATPSGVTSHADGGLVPGTGYGYRVRACNAGGCSAYTDEATAQTDDAPPPAPISLTATAVGGDQIDLVWQYGGTNEDGLHVERAERWRGVGRDPRTAARYTGNLGNGPRQRGSPMTTGCAPATASAAPAIPRWLRRRRSWFPRTTW